jgi:hypothetical protein
VELAVQLASLKNEKTVAKFAGQDIALNLETVDADLVPAPFRRN